MTPSATQAAPIGISDTSTYDRYVRAEWRLFASDPTRGTTARALIAGLHARRVLDIGCGAGQELRPFLQDRTVLGVGVDLAPEAGQAGRELFATEQPASRIGFLRAGAETLPFLAETFDVVICRLALPYTDNVAALGEIARVLRPGGLLFLKFHHARYYTLKLIEAIRAARLKPAVHACRVLAAGSVYHMTGRQPHGRLLGRETFQTRALLTRELEKQGLAIDRELPDSVPAAPSLLVRRPSAGHAARRT